MTTYRHFGDYVDSLQAFDGRTALTIRPFLRIERVSFGMLRQYAYQSAQYLIAQQIQAGDRIVIVAPNSPEWVALFLGAQLIGAVIVPVDVTSTPDIAEGFITRTKPKLIVRAEHVLPSLDKHGKVITLDTLFEAIASFPAKQPKYVLSGQETAVIVFTSGTTAAPKGVVLSQQNILSNVVGVQDALAIDPDWRLLSVLPLSHMYELTGGCLAPLSRGASIYYPVRVTPLSVVRALNDYRITTVLAIPQLLELMLDRIRQTAADEGKAKTFESAQQLARLLPLPLRRLLFREVHVHLGGSLSMFVTGGAAIPRDTMVAWERLGIKVLQGYGLTETSPILTVNRLDERRIGSAGRPLRNVQLRIGADQEIQAKGANVFTSYWHDKQTTHDAFTDDGWFKTGDTGSVRNAWLYIQGRLKFAIVLSSGLKVFPEDVEVVAEKHPALESVCVVGVQTANEETVQAVVISRQSDTKIDKAIQEINGQLPSFQHITSWRRWPEADFPRTRLLKVDRKQIIAWAAAGSAELKEPANGQSKDTLVTIIRRSAGSHTGQVHGTDRLADIGLDSLRRLYAVALIEEEMGVSIPEERVTQKTTVSELRKLVEQGAPATPMPPRPRWTYWRWVRWVGNGLRDTLVWGLIHIWVRVSVEGREVFETLDTPAIIIFNHTDDFDCPVVYRAVPRRIRKRLAIAAADDVMREHKPLAFIARLCYAAFNLNRSEPYMPSLAYACELVDRGWNIVLAPEGRISTSGQLQDFKSGIGLLAVELGIPVVVVKTSGLHGTVPLHAKWPKRHSRVTVRISQPVTFGRHEDYDQVTATLRDIMENL